MKEPGIKADISAKIRNISTRNEGSQKERTAGEMEQVNRKRKTNAAVTKALKV